MHELPPTPAERRLIDALKQRRKRSESGLFLAEGVRVAEELLDAGIVPRIVVVSSALEDTPRGRDLRRRLGAFSPRGVADHELARLADTEAPQGVLLVAPTPATALDATQLPEGAVVLVLDGIQDPGNFGTLARSAVAFGVAAIVTLPGTVDPWNPKSVRAAAGASFRVPVLALSPDAAVQWLRGHGFDILAADVGGAAPMDVPAAARVAIIVGNEGAGVSPAMLAAADRRVGIRMRGAAESLNVAVAAGILLHHFSERTTE